MGGVWKGDRFVSARRQRGRKAAAGILGLMVVLLLTLVQAGPAEARSRTADLSLEELVGQALAITLEGRQVTGANLMDLAEIKPGGVVLYTATGNIGTTEQVAGFAEEMQRWALRTSGIPLFVAIDQEGGWVNRIREGVTLFPGNMALGAAGAPSLAREAARDMGEELRALGINVDFAPVVDVNSNPRNPIIGSRSFGSSPREVAAFGIEAVKGYLEGGVLPVLKHFPGHGDTAVDSHLGLPLVSRDRASLESIDLRPFREAVADGAPAVMTAHIRVPALEPAPLPATFSRKILQGLLREEMGFRGVIFADSMGMGAIRKHWGAGEAAVAAFRAGVDMLIYGADPDYSREKIRRVKAALVEAVEKGEIPRERLEASVERILEAKERLGLFDDPFPGKQLSATLATPDRQALAREIARRAVTVVRNRGGVIPVGEPGPFPVLWPGGWTTTQALLERHCPMLEPVLVADELTEDAIEGIEERLSGREVVFAGCFDLFRRPAMKRLLRRLPADKLVLLSFRAPYDLMELPDAAGAVAVYSSTPPSFGALGDYLSGRLEPQGRLPVHLDLP
ncbi:MAG: glycoside hydrolase family 3 protein [Synergistales bacterium]|nr:glycoside hydrolase family 3 protein [Synergistales bacterium]